MVKFKIDGMGCESCAKKIQEEISKIEGVEKVEATLDPPQATIRGDLPRETLVQALSKLGFKATEI